jgi:hypothetical protein
MSEGIGFKITAYVSNKGNPECPMTHYIICPVCQGRIGFNLNEILELKSKGQATSVYCAGPEHITTRGDDPNNHYHPGYPPEPIYKFEWERE